jgi:hypothetical protein
MAWSSIWYRVRKFFGQLTYEEEQAESCKRLRQSLEDVHGVKVAPSLPQMPAAPPTPYMGSTSMFAGSVTKGPENIPGPHPKPKKKKRIARSITDDWEVTQDS